MLLIEAVVLSLLAVLTADGESVSTSSDSRDSAGDDEAVRLRKRIFGLHGGWSICQTSVLNLVFSDGKLLIAQGRLCRIGQASQFDILTAVISVGNVIFLIAVIGTGKVVFLAAVIIASYVIFVRTARIDGGAVSRRIDPRFGRCCSLL